MKKEIDKMTIVRNKDYSLISEVFTKFKEEIISLVPEDNHLPLETPLHNLEESLNKTITSLQNNPQQLFIDPLTGLPNKVLFRDRVQEALGRAKRSGLGVVIMALDIDNFSYYNDEYGYDTGDVLLKEVAQRLLVCLRKVDTVSRFSGDEFTILLESQRKPEDHLIVIQKVMKAFAAPFILHEKEWYVGISIGVTSFPEEAEDYKTLLRNADMAMHRAKELGKNTFQHYTPIINNIIDRRLKLENTMRKASIEDEFVVYFQPKVELGTGKISGMEALVRWFQPDGKLISPVEFIPLAEETGMILQIGEWVLRRSCMKTKEYHDKGYDSLIVSVNLSARQLDQKNILETIKSALDESGLKPTNLCLEITESAMMFDIKSAIEMMHKIKELGIKISIDDFGTGYSSLSHLAKMPVDELKIDRSFVVNVAERPDDAAITNAIISMAQSLNLNIIAEGVETHEQLAFLTGKGMMNIQGYIFSPAVTEDEFELLLEKSYQMS